jgi:hypothetical protein
VSFSLPKFELVFGKLIFLGNISWPFGSVENVKIFGAGDWGFMGGRVWGVGYFLNPPIAF